MRSPELVRSTMDSSDYAGGNDMSRFREWKLDCKVYIGDLGHGAAKHEIEDVFSKYGPLRNVWVARNPPGFAFVEFEDPRDAEDAVRALDGCKINGRRVRVERSNGKSRRTSGGSGGGGAGGSRRAPPRYDNDRSIDKYGRRRRSRSRSRSPRGRRASYSRSRSRSPRRSRSVSNDRRYGRSRSPSPVKDH